MRKVTIALLNNYSLYITTSLEEAEKYITKKKWKYNLPDTRVGTTIEPLDSDGNDVLMCVFDESIVTASHESLHAAMATLKYFGINFDYDNQEILAYTQEYIFKHCLTEMGVAY